MATASRGIAEVITNHYALNIDLRDAKTVLSNSGTAIMGSATASGENRAKDAIVAALDSPLLNDNKITGAKNVLLLIVFGTNEITMDEMGEINDYIQTEAGYSANIIMGAGEDESLGDAISVTVIATGFNVEQQAEIVNSEPKKIIHTLEGEQKLVQDLTQKPMVPSFDFSSIAQEVKPEPVAEVTPAAEEKIVFALEEEVEVVEKKPVAEVDLIPTSEFINNLDVFFEIVSPVKEEPKFEIKDVREIEVFGAEIVKPEVREVQEQISFSFDLTNGGVSTNDDRMVFDLTEETREMKVNEPVQVVPVTEVNESGVVRYSLDDYMEKENELLASKPVAEVKETPIAPELDITMRKAEEAPAAAQSFFDEISPVEMTIEETLRMRAEERKRKMKEFNYKFNNSASRVNELEREPAYKRMGVDLNSAPVDNSKSRMSLGLDSNDDIQLRSNNSFLHDNVD